MVNGVATRLSACCNTRFGLIVDLPATSSSLVFIAHENGLLQDLSAHEAQSGCRQGQERSQTLLATWHQ